MSDSGSFIDPQQERLQADREVLMRLVAANVEALQEMARRWNVTPEPGQIEKARFEVFLDTVFPPHPEGEVHDPSESPTSPERLAFEIAWQQALAEMLKNTKKEIAKQMLVGHAANGGLLRPPGM